MAHPVTIPRATLTLEEAVILGWKKQPGERVGQGEVLFEMETDKVVVEVPAEVGGNLLRIDIAEGTAKLSQVIGWIGEPGEILAATARQEPRGHEHPAVGGTGRIMTAGSLSTASPAARRRVRELGVDLARVKGTGPAGRITEKDVEVARNSAEE